MASPAQLGDALAGALDRHHRDLRAAADTATTEAAQGTRAAESAGVALGVPAAPAAGLHAPDRHAIRRARFDEAVSLHGQGWSARRIARALGADRQTVRGWRRSGELPNWRRRPRGSSVDRHAGHLDRRWDEGCRDAAQLWREIQALGFRGRLRTVQRWASGRRGADTCPSRVGATVAWRVPSKHRAAWLVVADAERLGAAELRFAEAMTARSPELGNLVGLARGFSAMVRRRQADRLDGWLAAEGLPPWPGSPAG